MKQLLSMLLILALSSCSLLFGASGQTADNAKQAEEQFTLSAMVTEATDGALLLDDLNGGTYEAHITPDTVFETSAPVQPGDWVTIIYNGMLTRSIPAQLTAQRVYSFSLTGVVGGEEADSFLLTLEDETQVQANLPETIARPQNGETVTVYYNGQMTYSLPGQVFAELVRRVDLEGEITGVAEDHVVLETENGEAEVYITESTRVLTRLEAGAKIRVATGGIMTLSLPPHYVALEILPQAAE